MPFPIVMPTPKPQFESALGLPLVGGKLYTYAAGTSTPKATYTSSAGDTVQANPITLNARGEPANPIFWDGAYYVELRDVLGNLVYSVDNFTTPISAGVLGSSDGAGLVGFSPTATYPLNTVGAYLLDLAKSGAAALIGFIQAGTGAVLRTVQSKLRDTISVTDYGAVGDGVADDTIPIQNAINQAGNGGVVVFPKGTYLLTATLVTPPNIWLKGAGPNSTIFRRQTDYGHTVNMAASLASKITGIWMYHGQSYVSGDTALTNLVTSATGHVRISGAQQLVIEDCWFWRMPYQVLIDDGSLIKIERCNMQGTWDDLTPQLQEGVASIIIGRTSYTQIVAVIDCYFGGSGSAASTVTYTSSDTGAHAFNGIIRNIGNQYAIQVRQCEDLLVADNYMGGNNRACISLNPIDASVNLDWRFSNNFLDGARLTLMDFTTSGATTGATGVTISDNVFNGELQTQSAITMANPLGGTAVLTNFTITGNSFQATVGTPIVMYNAMGGLIAGNSITGYNARQVSLGGDPTFASAIVTAASTGYCSLDGNIMGGNVNGIAGASYCYNGHSRVGGANKVTETGTMFNGAGVNGDQRGRVDLMVTFVTAAAYTMLPSDQLVIVNRATAIAGTLAGPGLITTGYKCTIKDGKGDAATNATTFQGTVDGVLNPVYNTAYFSRTLCWNGIQWNSI